jgi:hypothetical protein
MLLYTTHVYMAYVNMTGLRGGPAGQLPGVLRRHRNNQKYVAANSRVSTRQRISPQFGHAPSKTVLSPVIGLKSLKNIGLKGRQINGLPGEPTCLGVALHIKHVLCAITRTIREALYYKFEMSSFA